MVKDILIIHHSHTDIGYTELQERIIQKHVYYIRHLLQQFQNNPSERDNSTFKWNCETYFCVEQFLQQASLAEQQYFYDLIKSQQIGISANYLNFTDLVDTMILQERIAQMQQTFQAQQILVRSAMIADINGISMGVRDAFLSNGVEFLYANVHCHHGMYPLWQNQKPFYWQNSSGQKLLVWSGEHYHLGNVLGLLPNTRTNFMSDNYLGKSLQQQTPPSAVEQLINNLTNYLKECEEYDYPYSFMPISVSGVFSDNGPPNFKLVQMIEQANPILQKREQGPIRLQMVTLDELFERIQQEPDIPVFQGDWTDWWVDGVGSTPYAVKHYKEAQRIYHQCRQLQIQGQKQEHNTVAQAGAQDSIAQELCRKWQQESENNLLLFAEHTWGHSASITDPYDDMVNTLDIRNISYASKAYEAAACWLQQLQCGLGDNFNSYAHSGKVRVVNIGQQTGQQVVEFYIETGDYGDIQLHSANNQKEIISQISPHPRGVLVSFYDSFQPGEVKDYVYTEQPKKPETINSRVVYIGSERVRDIVNDYDPVSYQLPYFLESPMFRLSYRLGSDSDPGGIYSVYSKWHQAELWNPTITESTHNQSNGQVAHFFSPIYEYSPIRENAYEERRLLGRNIRGLHAIQNVGSLKDVKILEQGPIFHKVELIYTLAGTRYCSIVITMFQQIPRIDFFLRCAKKITDAPESLYLPLSLQIPGSTCYIGKGGSAFRPGIDQIPGTCMEYYLSEQGLLFHSPEQPSLAIRCLDAPMLYMGELKHHPVQLCTGSESDNQRPIYSWVMNNIWETNFKIDLSGYGQFRYRLELLPKTMEPQKIFQQLQEGENICFPID